MITLYSTGCPKCTVLKKKLDERGVTYIENNSVEEMQSLGITEIPVLFVDNIQMSFIEAVKWANSQ